MQNLTEVAAQVKKGETIIFTTLGNSMVPIIQPGDEVVVAPLTATPQVGQVVLARVHGHWSLNRVSRLRGQHVRLVDGRGRVFGWSPNVIGVVIVAQEQAA